MTASRLSRAIADRLHQRGFLDVDYDDLDGSLNDVASTVEEVVREFRREEQACKVNHNTAAASAESPR